MHTKFDSIHLLLSNAAILARDPNFGISESKKVNFTDENDALICQFVATLSEIQPWYSCFPDIYNNS